MILNVGIRRAKSRGIAFYDADWVYAGGATLSVPTTIYSNVNGSNSITIKYNGLIVYVTKTVSGVTTYVTKGLTNSAGTYRIKAVTLPNNTIQLYVGGVPALAGYGTEKVSPYPLDLQGQAWTTVNATISSATQFTAGTTATVYVAKTLTGTGNIFRVRAGGTPSSGTLSIVNATSGAIVGSMNTDVDYLHPDGANMGFTLRSHLAGAVVTGCTFSKKEIYNNTDTQKYTFV